MASLTGTEKAVGVRDEDAETITALLGKIDPTGDLAASVLQCMGEGKGEDALALITGAFAKLDPDESIEISRDDALALGRGLGLNKNSLQSLADNFGRYDALRVTGEQFGNLMKPASMQFATDKANREKLDAALEQTLKPIISKARDRMEKEKAASAPAKPQGGAKPDSDRQDRAGAEPGNPQPDLAIRPAGRRQSGCR